MYLSFKLLFSPSRYSKQEKIGSFNNLDSPENECGAVTKHLESQAVVIKGKPVLFLIVGDHRSNGSQSGDEVYLNLIAHSIQDGNLVKVLETPHSRLCMDDPREEPGIDYCKNSPD